MRPHVALQLCLSVVVATSAAAQRLWLAPDPGRNVGFEFTKGFLKSGSGVGFATFLLTADGRFPLKDNLAVTASFPIAHVSEQASGFGGPGLDETAIGDPWIGLELKGQHGLVGEFGIRPGVASESNEEALSLGFDEDFDHFEAWVPEVTTFRAVAHIGDVPERGTFVTGILGGSLFVPHHGGDASVWANYGIRAGFRDGSRLVSLALTGRLVFTHFPPGASLADRTVHQVALIVEGTHGNFRPVASIRTYLDEAPRTAIPAIVTVGASFILR